MTEFVVFDEGLRRTGKSAQFRRFESMMSQLLAAPPEAVTAARAWPKRAGFTLSNDAVCPECRAGKHCNCDGSEARAFDKSARTAQP